MILFIPRASSPPKSKMHFELKCTWSHPLHVLMTGTTLFAESQSSVRRPFMMASAPRSSSPDHPNPNLTFEELGPISEDNLLREQSASPEPIDNVVDHFDFERTQHNHGTKSTHLPISNGLPERSGGHTVAAPRIVKEERQDSLTPSEESRSSIIGGARQKPKSRPPRTFDKGKFNEAYGPNQDARRSSTMATKNSESFEDTAVWDQKAILSLGTSMKFVGRSEMSRLLLYRGLDPMVSLYGSIGPTA